MIRILLLVAGLLTASCSRPASVRVTVAPGSTVQHLTFVLHPAVANQPIRGLRVAWSRLAGRYPGSQGRELWTILSPQGHDVAAPDSVQYGVAPSGFTAPGATALGPGRYEVEVFVGGRSSISYFTVAADGTVSS